MAFVIGLCVWLGLSLLAVLNWRRAQLEYIELYRRRRGIDIELSETIERPRLLLSDSLKVLRICNERQEDEVLERARRRVWHRWRAAIAVGILGGIAFVMTVSRLRF